MNLRSFVLVTKNSVIVDLEYRFNYVMLLFSSVLTLLMEWAIFANVYQGNETVGGLPYSSAFAFVLYGMVIRTVHTLWGIVMESIDEIREGSFRRFLLQPITHPLYFFAQVIGNKLTPFIAGVIICLVYKFALNAPDNFLSLATLPWAVTSFLLSGLLLWCIYLVILYASFFVEESHFLQYALNVGIGVFSGTILPLSWYPEIVQKLLHYTPLPVLGDWPLRSALGLMDTSEWMNYLAKCGLWLGATLVIIALMHRKGLRRYEAFGG